jgi:molybdopterin adenylyltransferase
MIRVAVLTVSDAGFRGERADLSGDAIERWVKERGYQLAARALVPDESVEIVRQLLAWCDSGGIDLVLVTGGTGLAQRDVTPEATRAVLEREAPGLAELLRVRHLERFPRAALSRAVAGVRGATLIIDLPGSPAAVSDALELLAPLLGHAVDIATGRASDHSPVVK